MSRSEAVKFILIRSLGNFLLLFALYGVIATFGPAVYYEARFWVIEARGVQFTVGGYHTTPVQSSAGVNSTALHPHPNPLPSKEREDPGFAQILAGPKEQVLIPKDTQFSIVIPKIGASAKIFPNVDPDNPNEFMPILLQGIAHAKGSVFPGMPGNVYLFAHSTDTWFDVGRYNAVFYLLHDLAPGDEIVIFYQNKRYEYSVDHSVITGPNDVSFIARDHNGPEQLVLQTCWPPGTALERYYVIAKPKGI